MNGLPQVSRREQSADRLEIEFTLEPDNRWFEGHFPQRSILPGVVQIGWAVHFAASLRGHPAQPLRLERVKFKYPVEPGARLRLQLDGAGDRVKYAYDLLGPDEPVAVSSGVLCYEAGT